MFDLVSAHHNSPTPSFLDDQDKVSNRNLYLLQPHTVIELVEVAPPPPRRISSVINSSSAASSSYSSSSSSSSFDDEEDEDEEEQSVCSSYCSSDFPLEPLDSPSPTSCASQNPFASIPQSDSFSRRMKSILKWRENSDFCSDSSSLKRKSEAIEEPMVDYADTVSHASKRSRSQASSISSRSISSAEFNVHPCPACDSFFPTLQSLRQHGQRGSPQSNEACCVAVEYAFEQ